MSALARRRLGSIGVLITFVVLAACTRARAPFADASILGASSAQIITRREIGTLMTHYASAYDLIQRARPNMLTLRESRVPYSVREGIVSEPVEIKVIVDANVVGGLEMLRRIPSRSIIFIQRLSQSDATTRYGSGMVAGAIVVTTGARLR